MFVRSCNPFRAEMRRPLHHSLWHLPEHQHPAVNLVRQIDQFLGAAGAPLAHSPAAPEPANPGDEARAELDHASIDSRHTGVRVEHHRPRYRRQLNSSYQ